MLREMEGFCENIVIKQELIDDCDFSISHLADVDVKEEPLDIPKEELKNILNINSNERKLESINIDHNYYSKEQKIRIVSNLNQVKRLFKCSICNYYTEQEERSIAHAKTHMRQTVYKCEKCNYSTKVEEFYKNHIKKAVCENLHKKPKIEVRCDLGLKKWSFSKNKQRKFRPYMCTYCPMITKNLQVYKNHINEHTVLMLKCTKCNFITADRKEFEAHKVLMCNQIKSIKKEPEF